MTARTIGALALLAATGLGAGAVASCSSEDNPTPSGVVPGNDAGTDTGGDPVVPDAGGCTSDATTCNACTTSEADPYNACSTAAVNCVPFDNEGRLPKDPNGGLPQVP